MHDLIRILSCDEIYEYNLLFSDGSKIRKSVESAFSSYMYYETKEEQVCSIFNNIIRGHYFTDGNKRTSVMALISLCISNNIDFNLTNKEVYEIAIKVAKDHLSIPDIAKLIFHKN